MFVIANDRKERSLFSDCCCLTTRAKKQRGKGVRSIMIDFLSKQEDCNDNEIIVTLKISKRHYEAGLLVSRLLDFKSFTEYAESAICESIEMEVNGDGSLGINYDTNKSALEKVYIPRIHPK